MRNSASVYRVKDISRHFDPVGLLGIGPIQRSVFSGGRTSRAGCHGSSCALDCLLSCSTRPDMGASRSSMYAEAVPVRKTSGWYGVRALFRLIATGKPKWTDRYFDPNATLVEDRIVLFRARSFDDAIRQAEAEAKRYSNTTRFKNIYGQQVHLKFLRAIDAFHTFIEDQPLRGSEIYSKTEIVPKSVRDSVVVTDWWGSEERSDWGARHKFVDGKILMAALEVIRQQEAKPRPRARKK
jgi:Domain of unknown function (DUF4288)